MSYGNYPNLSLVKKALVIKLRHHGDVLLTSPVFSNLQAAMPHAQIDALVYKETFPMLEGHPAIHHLIAYDRSWKKLRLIGRLAKEWELLKTIWNKGYDLVINLTEGDRGAIMAFASGAPLKVGIDPEGQGFLGKRKIYTHLVKMCKTPRHTVEKNLDIIRKIGIFPTPEERDLFLSIPLESKERVLKLLAEQQITAGNYFLLHPVSRWRFKCWPSSLVAELIVQLHTRGEKIVISSSLEPQELKMVQEILSLVPHVPVVNLGGEISLKELGALIEQCKCLVSVDSVPLHISSALKIPVVVLFGPSSELNWGPWQNPRARVVAQHLSCRPCFMDGCGGSKMSDCLHTLPVAKVLRAVDEVVVQEPIQTSV